MPRTLECERTVLLERQPVEATELAEYFETEARDRRVPLRVEVLERASAELMWGQRFGPTSRSYQSLPDDSPIVRANWVSIAQWQSAYSHDAAAMQPVLAEAMSWSRESPVLFCVSNALVLSCSWEFFTRMWDCFLALEDDSPFVVCEHEQDREILWFTPLGEIRKAELGPHGRRTIPVDESP